jgi:hypothetical protein
MSDDGSAAYVLAQPEGDRLDPAAQALSDCPVGAIGNDA